MPTHTFKAHRLSDSELVEFTKKIQIQHEGPENQRYAKFTVSYAARVAAEAKIKELAEDVALHSKRSPQDAISFVLARNPGLARIYTADCVSDREADVQVL